MTQNNGNGNLGPDCFDKISASENIIQTNEQKSGDTDQKLENDTENNSESDMDWTVRHNRLRCNCSPNKKSKKSSATIDNGQKLETKSVRKPRNNDRNELNKDSVLVVVTEIPDDTYFNAIRMENMILRAFPRLKEPGM